MIHVIASLSIKEGQVEEFIGIFKSNIPNVLKERGCIEYVPAIDLPTGLPVQELNPNVVTIIEKWESLADLKAHAAAPHMVSYHKKVKGLVEKASIKVLENA